MKKFLLALAAVLVAAPVYAAPELSSKKGQIDNPSALRVHRGYGTLVTLSSEADATYEAVNWGFIAAYVEVCLQDDATLTYFRFDTSLPTNATSAANFISDPNTSVKAIPITGSGDGTDQKCIEGPWATDGLVFYSAGNATLDVRAYGE